MYTAKLWRFLRGSVAMVGMDILFICFYHSFRSRNSRNSGIKNCNLRRRVGGLETDSCKEARPGLLYLRIRIKDTDGCTQ